MSVKLENIVRKYYEALDKGDIIGRKCSECGNVEFPPVLACNACGSTDMEWVKMSGKARLLTIISQAALNMKPENTPLKPYCLGIIEMEEGSQFNGLVMGITKRMKKELEPKLPLPIHAEIIEIKHGDQTELDYKTIVFKLDE